MLPTHGEQWKLTYKWSERLLSICRLCYTALKEAARSACSVTGWQRCNVWHCSAAEHCCLTTPEDYRPVICYQVRRPTLLIFTTGAETISRLGKQKVVKNNHIQSITLCNMYFFQKCIRSVQWGLGLWAWGKAPEAGEFSRIFVLKVTLQTVRLLLTVSYRKIGGEGCTTVAPQIFLLGEQLLPLLPRFPRLWCS